MKEEKTSYEWGVLWMVLSATLLAFYFLFLKLNLESFSTLFVLFLRFFIPFIIVLIVLWVKKQFKELKDTDFKLHLYRTFCVIVAQYGIAFYISKSTLLNATVLMNAAPLFIPFIEWIFQRIRPGVSTLISAGLAFLGVILILRPGVSLFTPLSGVALLAALGQAGSQVLYGVGAKKEKSFVSLFYLFSLTSLFSFLILLFFGKKMTLSFQGIETIALLNILLMGFSSFLNQYFRGKAYKCGRPSQLTTFLYVAVFIAAILDVTVFHSIPDLMTIVGSVLIILAGIVKIVLRNYILKRKNK